MSRLIWQSWCLWSEVCHTIYIYSYFQLVISPKLRRTTTRWLKMKSYASKKNPDSPVKIIFWHRSEVTFLIKRPLKQKQHNKNHMATIPHCHLSSAPLWPSPRPISKLSLKRQCVIAPLCGPRGALWITPLAAVNGTLLSHSITQSTPPTWQDKQQDQEVAPSCQSQNNC